MKACTGVLTLTFMLILTVSASAEPPGSSPFLSPPPFMMDKELNQLGSEAAALALLHELKLNAEQKGTIKEILQPVRARFARMETEEANMRESVMKARLRQIIADLKAGRDPAPPPKTPPPNLSVMRNRMATLVATTNEAYEKVQGLLTAEQRQTLNSFRFEKYVVPFRVMPPGGVHDVDPVEMIEQIRGASGEELAILVERIRERGRPGGPPPPGGREPDPSRQERVEMFAALLVKIHDMPQDEFDRKVETLKQELSAISPGPGDRPPPPPDGRGPRGPEDPMKKGFDPKSIVLSRAFYDAL